MVEWNITKSMMEGGVEAYGPEEVYNPGGDDSGDFSAEKQENIETQEDENAKKRELINAGIENVIAGFEEGEQTEKDFSLMIESLKSLRSVDRFNSDRAWDQGQINKMVGLFGKYDIKKKYSVLPEERALITNDFSEIFTTGRKENDENSTVSDFVAISLINIIEKGEEIPKSLQKQIEIWCKNIDMVHKDVRADFLFALLDNPKSISDDLVHEAIMGLSTYGPELVLEMKEMISGNADIGKAIKNIKILQYLTYQNDYESEGITAADIRDEMQTAWEDYQEAKKNGFKNKDGYYELRDERENYHAAMMAARIVLGEVAKESENFFIRAEIEQELEDLDEIRKDTKRLRDKYDKPELKNNYNIPPAFTEIYGKTDDEYIKRATEQSTYSLLSRKYAVIYDPDNLAVDSFVSMDQNGREAPKRLSIYDILEIEGFKKDDIGDDRYKEIALTYKTLVELPLRDRVEKKLKIKLEDYGVREQVQFVNFLSSKSVDEVEKVKKFLDDGADDTARRNRVKSFLSLEQDKRLLKQDKRMADVIFDIGSSDQKTADAIFAKYAEIVDSVDKVRGELNDLFKENRAVYQEQKEIIIQNLFKKANEVLVNFSEKIKESSQEDMLAELEKSQLDLILTAAVFKSLKDSGDPIKPEEMEGVTFHQITARQLNEMPEAPDMIAQMVDIYNKNYDTKDALRKKLVGAFQKQIDSKSDSVALFIYEKNGKVMAFNRFDDEGDGKLYLAACNVADPVAGSRFGDTLIKTSISQMIEAEQLKNSGKSPEITADCLTEKEISRYYLKNGKNGFVAKSFSRSYQGTGEQAFGIRWNADNPNYYYRGESFGEQQIFAEYKNFAGKEAGAGYEEYLEKGQSFILKFKRDTEEFFSATESILGDNNAPFVLTRYIFKNGNVYCAFEPDRGGK